MGEGGRREAGRERETETEREREVKVITNRWSHAGG